MKVSHAVLGIVHDELEGVNGHSLAAAVDLLMGTEGVAATRPETIPNFFCGALKKNAGGVALKVKREGEWRNYTFQQYWDTVVSVAKSYLKVCLPSTQAQICTRRHTHAYTHPPSSPGGSGAVPWCVYHWVQRPRVVLQQHGGHIRRVSPGHHNYTADTCYTWTN